MNNDLFNEFDNYVKKFDLNNEKISDKYKHSYRVYEYAKDIANSLKLDKNDITLAMICSLLHDIGRFSQVKEFDTFIDSKSIDHGDRGYEVLIENNLINKFVSNEEERDIVLFSVKNHNKFAIEETNDERKIMFANIVRDADKIDIMIEQMKEIEDDKKINKKCIDDIMNRKLCNNNSVVSDLDKVIRLLSFVFDINYSRSLEIINEKGVIKEKINLLRENSKLKDIDDIEKQINNYIKERLEC